MPTTGRRVKYGNYYEAREDSWEEVRRYFPIHKQAALSALVDFAVRRRNTVANTILREVVEHNFDAGYSHERGLYSDLEDALAIAEWWTQFKEEHKSL